MVLEIDEEYAVLGDVFDLTKLATCDRCADLLARKRDTLETIKRTTASLIWLKHSAMSTEQAGKFKGILTNLLKKYVGIAGEWRRLDLHYEAGMAEDLFDHPEKLPIVLSKIWTMK